MYELEDRSGYTLSTMCILTALSLLICSALLHGITALMKVSSIDLRYAVRRQVNPPSFNLHCLSGTFHHSEPNKHSILANWIISSYFHACIRHQLEIWMIHSLSIIECTVRLGQTGVRVRWRCIFWIHPILPHALYYPPKIRDLFSPIEICSRDYFSRVLRLHRFTVLFVSERRLDVIISNACCSRPRRLQ